jgi:hypothetical protein
MTPILTLDSSVRPAPHVLAEILDGEQIMLDLKTGVYYGLNTVGTRAWALLAQERCSVRHMAAVLSNEFDVTAERCSQDLLALIGTMHHKGLVELCDEPAP